MDKGVEPGFASAAEGDYTLDPSSALIDTGLVIPGINDYYAGAGPDIGAYESPVRIYLPLVLKSP